MKNLFSLSLIILMITVSSCEEASIKEGNIDDIDLPKTKVRDAYDDTINGGSLPEVTVTAVYIAHGGGDGGGAAGGTGWWRPPFTDIANPPSGGGGSDGNVGGSRPNPPLPTVTLAKDLVTLFSKGCDFLKDDLEKLNSVYKEMYDDCTYKALSNLMVNNKYSGGKIMMKPAGGSVGQASVDRLGNLKFYGSDEITVENLSHEWIHLSQRCLKPEVWADDATFIKYQGMLEFEEAMFKDIVYYLKYNKIDSGNEPNLPYHRSWVSKLDIDETQKSGVNFVFAAWIVENFINNQVPEQFEDLKTYNLLCVKFLESTRVYKNLGYHCVQDYSFETLNSLVSTVYTNCLKNK